MKEQLISFETAKLAKEKGFNEECYFTYGEISEDYCLFKSEYSETNSEVNEYIYSAPTQSLLQKWLREVHNCHVEVIFHSPLDDSYITKDNLRYCFEVNYYGKNFNIPFTDDEDYSGYDYLTYEEALEKGLQEALKLI